MRRSPGRPRPAPSSGHRSRSARSRTSPGPDGMGGTGAAPGPGEAEIGRIFREESGRSVAALIRVFGDIDVAEDAVQEAFAIALGKWPGDGQPPGLGGWITTTARNRAIDRLRRESRGRELLSEVAVLSPGTSDPGMPEEAGPVEDDRLRLIFTCCHPALSTEAQVALTLRLLGGLSTREVARSFLVTEHTMAVRLVRAKRKIKAARIPYRVPGDHELPARLRPVLAVVYLIYTAGLASPAEPGLCPEAIRLARILATLMPDEPEVAGLLALLLLTESRRASRTQSDGSLVLLGEQDQGAVGLCARRAAGLGQEQQRQQPGHLRLVGHERGQDPGQPDRFRAQARFGRAGQPGGVDEVDDGQDGAQAGGQLVISRNA